MIHLEIVSQVGDGQKKKVINELLLMAPDKMMSSATECPALSCMSTVLLRNTCHVNDPRIMNPSDFHLHLCFHSCLLFPFVSPSKNI